MISPTNDRVTANTSAEASERVRHAAEVRLHYYKDHPQEIDDRLDKLDEEWDIERALQAVHAGVSLVLIFIALIVPVWTGLWLFLLLVAQALVMLHVVNGFSLTMYVLRGLGFRSTAEIVEEGHALRDMRAFHVADLGIPLGAPTGAAAAPSPGAVDMSGGIELSDAPAPPSPAPPPSPPAGGESPAAPPAAAPAASVSAAPVAPEAAMKPADPKPSAVEGGGPIEIRI